jgi:hypothetical protein
MSCGIELRMGCTRTLANFADMFFNNRWNVDGKI